MVGLRRMLGCAQIKEGQLEWTDESESCRPRRTHSIGVDELDVPVKDALGLSELGRCRVHQSQLGAQALKRRTRKRTHRGRGCFERSREDKGREPSC